MELDEAILEFERVDAQLAQQDNPPVNQACTQCPTFVDKVSGPSEVYLGKKYTFKVEKYNREIKGTYWQEKVSWEVSLYRETEVLGPDTRKSVESIILANHGEILKLDIKEEWAFLGMQVFAYINNPIDNVSVKPLVRGAWAVTKQWNTVKIAEYRKYAKNTSDVYFRGNVRQFVCEDFATSLVMQFARENNLPFKISNGTGTYDAKKYHYSEHTEAENHTPFDQVMLKTTGAPDLNPNNQSNTQYIVNKSTMFSYNDALKQSRIKSGMIHIMDTSSNGVTNHIQVITEVEVKKIPPYKNKFIEVMIAPFIYNFVISEIEIHQGNFPDNTAAVGRGIGAFLTLSEEEDIYSKWYLGVPLQKGKYETPSGNYMRQGISSGLLYQQVQAVVDWNFLSWN